MSREDDSVFSRWSRRKRAVADEERIAVPPPPEDIPPPLEDELSEPELLEKLGLPDPDTMEKGDDFSAFMAKNIPAALRRRALHRLWRSDPVLANLDGLLDHGEDYTDAATVPKVFKTAYEVGRGIVRKTLEEPELDPDEITPKIEDNENVIASVRLDPPPQNVVPIPWEPEPEAENDALDDNSDAPRPRRMAFTSNNLSNPPK